MTFMFVPDKDHKLPFTTPSTIGDCLTKYCDLTSLIRKKVLKDLA